jgi:hypothetical protein
VEWLKDFIIKRVAGADFNCKVGWTSCSLSHFACLRINLHSVTNDSRIAAWKICNSRVY